MGVPRIENLRRENWQTLSPAERLNALQDLENSLATQEGRDQPCEVDYLSNCPGLSAEDLQNTRGLQVGQKIYINDNLIGSDTPSLDTPYMATETLFHESRHAYQDHVAANPELAADREQLQDFQMNRGDGYLSPEEYPAEYYLWQPVEKDSREEARQRTEELYGEEFQDNTQYPEHRRKMEAEEKRYVEIGEDYLGENYEEVARQEAYGRQEQFQMERQQSSQPEAGDGRGADEVAEIAQPTTEELGEAAGETAGQAAGEAAAGPAGAAAGEEVGREAGRAAGEAAQEQAEAAGQSTEAPAEAAEEAASDAPAGVSSEEEDRDYDYGYSYGL